MKRILALLVFSALTAGVFAEHSDYYRRSRSDGYFFRPPRTLFYFRPDYLFPSFQLSSPYYGYGYVHPGYSSRSRPYSGYVYGRLPGRLGYPAGIWATAARGAYSLYLESPGAGPVIRSNSADLILKVTPSLARVFLDGKLIGSGRDFTTERSRYPILDGLHEIRVEHPGFKPFLTEIDVEPNRTVHLDIELEPQPGK